MIYTDWKSNRKNFLIKEAVFIYTCLFILVVAFVTDRIGLFLICNKSSIMSIIQIQATVATLAITIVTVMASLNEKTYLGIRLSQYYMEKLPRIFSQKVISISTLFFIILSIFLYCFNYLNSALAVFVITDFLVIVSVINVYNVIEYKHTNSSIAQYLYYRVSVAQIEELQELYENFIDEWKRQNYSNHQVYESYSTILLELNRIVLAGKDKKNCNLVNRLSGELQAFFLVGESSTIKLLGWELMYDLYFQNSSMVKGNEDDSNCESKDFIYTMLQDNIWDIRDSLSFISIDRFERSVDVGTLLFIIEKIVSGMGDSSEKEKLQDNLFYIARCMGNYVSEQRNKGHKITNSYWKHLFNIPWQFFPPNESDVKIESFFDCHTKLILNLAYGFLLYGEQELFVEAFFGEYLHSKIKVENRAELLCVLSVYCFIIYLAEEEDEKYLRDNQQSIFKKIIENNMVSEAINNYLYGLSNNSFYFDKHIRKDMIELLKRLEILPNFSEAKSMIMHDVVNKFYLFIALYLHDYSIREVALSDLIDEEVYIFFSSPDEKDNMIAYFENRIRLIGDTGNGREKAEELYNVFVSEVAILQKTKVTNEAEEYSKNVSSKVVSYEKDITNNFIKCVNDKYKFLNNNAKGEHALDITLVRIKTPISIIDRMVNELSKLPNNLFSGMTELLKKENGLTFLPRERFEDGEGVIKYIEDNNYGCLYGPESYFMPGKGWNREVYDYLRSDKVIYYPVPMDCGVVIDLSKVDFYINNIFTSIEDGTIEDSVSYEVDENGVIQYRSTNGIVLSFEKKEFKKYIAENWKVITVRAELSMSIKGSPVGTILYDR